MKKAEAEGQPEGIHGTFISLLQSMRQELKITAIVAPPSCDEEMARIVAGGCFRCARIDEYPNPIISKQPITWSCEDAGTGQYCRCASHASFSKGYQVDRGVE
jgi:hypothetical protein